MKGEGRAGPMTMRPIPADWDVKNNILETIGNTPLVRLNRVTAGIKATVIAKLEYFNPGGSVKDRIGYQMIDDFEARGKLKPGVWYFGIKAGKGDTPLSLTEIRICSPLYVEAVTFDGSDARTRS